MFPFSILLAGLLLAGVAPAMVLDKRQAAVSACSQLIIHYPDQTYLPSTQIYTNETTNYHSKACVLSPDCVFQPNNAEDIASFLTVIRKTQSAFAVRSGGHMPVPGAADTNNGVLLALTRIANNTLNADNSILSIGSGQVWDQVYSFISPYGLAVAGGRYGEVGVGGLLTGGGINFFGQTNGWSVNSIIGYEIVLGDSNILEVSAAAYPDLFWSLKGGNNNFGIVTRFDMKTIPVTAAYTGGTTYTGDAIPSLIAAIAAFIAPGGGMDDINTVINPIIDITPPDGTMRAGNIPFVRGNYSETPASIVNFTRIGYQTYNNVGPSPDWSSITQEVTAPAYNTDANRVIFRSVGLKALPEMIQFTYDIIIPSAAMYLKNVTGSDVTIAYQPISQRWVQAAQDAGGDAISLDPADGSFISVLITCEWTKSADDPIITAWSEAIGTNLTQAAQAKNAYHPFIYLNDAAAGQQPYPLYGKGTSLPKMKAVQQKYDVGGVFQDLESSGFKLTG